MRHLLLSRWSCLSSPIHRLPATTKLAALLLWLTAVSLSPAPYVPWLAAPLAAAALASRIPLGALLKRAALVLPFSAALALTVWFSSDASRASSLLGKSYLSSTSALLFAATTPLPAWTAALRIWRVPPALISTLQFLYRYLFVVAEEAQTISTAARSRGGFRFTAAAGAIAVLFARSWQRAESVHRCMLARGHS